MARAVIFWAVALILAAAIAARMTMVWALSPVDPSSTDTQVVEIPRGATVRQIAEDLERRGLIQNAWAMLLFLRHRGDGARLQAGEYALSPAMSLEDIVEKLMRGEVITYPITIPEGYTVRQVRDLLVARGWADPERLDALLGAVQDGRPALAAEFPFLPEVAGRPDPLEGYLFPDTYRFPRGVTEKEILRAMLARFALEVTPEVGVRLAELGWTVDQAVILASIIEKEARLAEERPIISGVYHNRLRIGMKLDADPTVLYALGNPDQPLLLRDLDLASPYNTYRNAGLPPGPIANPGAASLQAALYPAEVPYFFFVARPDGSHVFARTYQEHLRNLANLRPR